MASSMKARGKAVAESLPPRSRLNWPSATSQKTKIALVTRPCKFIKVSIGQVLAICMAEISEIRPADPIAYMAYWLYQYACNRVYIEEKVENTMTLVTAAKQLYQERQRAFARMRAIRHKFKDLHTAYYRVAPADSRLITKSSQNVLRSATSSQRGAIGGYRNDVVRISYINSLHTSTVESDLDRELSVLDTFSGHKDVTLLLKPSRDNTVSSQSDGIYNRWRSSGSDSMRDRRSSSQSDGNRYKSSPTDGMHKRWRSSLSDGMYDRWRSSQSDGMYDSRGSPQSAQTVSSQRSDKNKAFSVTGMSGHPANKPSDSHKRRDSRAYGHLKLPLKSSKISLDLKSKKQCGWYLEMPMRRMVCHHPVLGRLTGRKARSGKFDNTCFGKVRELTPISLKSLYDPEIYVRHDFDEQNEQSDELLGDLFESKVDFATDGPVVDRSGQEHQ